MISFFVDVKVRGKARPRFVKKTGHVMTDPNYKTYEAIVRRAAVENTLAPLEGPLRLDVIAHFPMAQSWSSKKKLDFLGEPHTQKPDGDNILKAVADALNGVCYQDDKQLSFMVCDKVWTRARQGLLITVYPHTETWRKAADAANLTTDEILQSVQEQPSLFGELL